MPNSIATLLKDLGESWSQLRPLPALDTLQFDRWSVEAGQVLEVVASLGGVPDSEHREVDEELLELADRCRLLGECGMSATLAATAARRFQERGDPLGECRARRVEGISLRISGDHEAARRHLGETFNWMASNFPDEPLTGVLQADYAACVADPEQAGGLLTESLERLEQCGRQGFEARVRRSYRVERSRRHAGLAEAGLALLWRGGLSAEDFAAAVERVRRHLHTATYEGIPAVEAAGLGVHEAELALVCGRRERGLELLRTLERQGHEDPALGRVLAPTYRLLAQYVAKEGDRRTAIEYCRRALLASLHFGNRAYEPLAVDTFVEIMHEPRQVDEGSPEIENLARVLIEMLEAKDWYTGRNHSQSVGSLSQRLGRALQKLGHGSSDPSSLDWLDLKALRLGGQLHDVGKLAIPWSLLNKINPLSPDELRHVRSHVVKSEEFLHKLGLERVGRFASQHHERSDGHGYPRGTSEISLMGATIAVADAFEAMITSNRRYRGRLTRDEAVEEVVRCRGTMFDPRVVDAMIDIFRRPSDTLLMEMPAE